MSRASILVTLAVVLSLGSLAAMVVSCSYFHDSFPGESCTTGMDCFQGAEVCDPTSHRCVPNYDAGPTPDTMPMPDTPPAPDAGPDSGADAADDAAIDAGIDAAFDAGVPDA